MCTRPVRKQKLGRLPSFLSGFLRRRKGHASFLNLRFRSLPPPSGAELFVAPWIHARGTIAKRRKYGRFCWGQQDQLLHLLRGRRRHLQASPEREQLRYGPESEWVLLTHAQ